MNNSTSFIEETIARLMNRVLIIVFILPCIYLAVHYFYHFTIIPVALVLPFLVLPLLVYTLNRFKQYEWSKFVGLLGYNTAVFLVASSERTATGVYLHFVSCCSVTIALYKYTERWKSILFIMFSMGCFLAINLFSFDLLPLREYGPAWTKIFFVIHLTSSAVISSYSFFTVLSVNYRAQQDLKIKQEMIEQQNEELRKANRELDKFVYSASHDLRAPLTSILGLVNLMEMDSHTPTQEYLAKIKGQISKMETFMKDVVDYSRNARLDLKLEDVKLCFLVNDVVKSLAYFDNAHTIAFEILIDPKRVIRSDSYRLSVILNNLISNSVKYADHRKPNSFVRISLDENGSSPVIRIEDNGIGIDEGHLPKIFDMFYRASEASNGSGLGLYIAMESAQKLNYKISAQSKINEGTVFSIELSEPVDV